MTAADDFQDAIENLAENAGRTVLQIFTENGSAEESVTAIVAAIQTANAQATALADFYVAAQVEEVQEAVALSVGLLPIDESERLVKAVRKVFAGDLKTKFTRDEITELILSAGLDPDHWDIPTITRQINESLQSNISDDPDADADYRTFEFADFIETVNENPKKLSERGLFPPPPPGTPEYEQWKVDSLVPLLNSDDFIEYPPIWTPEPEDAGTRLERLAHNEPLETAQKAASEALSQQKTAKGYLGWQRQLNANACQLCQWWAKDGRIWPPKHGMARHVNCACVQKVVVSATRPKPVRKKRK